jgi:hypothetical protein
MYVWTRWMSDCDDIWIPSSESKTEILTLMRNTLDNSLFFFYGTIVPDLIENKKLLNVSKYCRFNHKECYLILLVNCHWIKVDNIHDYNRLHSNIWQLKSGNPINTGWKALLIKLCPQSFLNFKKFTFLILQLYDNIINEIKVYAS